MRIRFANTCPWPARDIIRELGSDLTPISATSIRPERAPSQGSFILDDDGQQIVDFHRPVSRRFKQDFQTVCRDDRRLRRVAIPERIEIENRIGASYYTERNPLAGRGAV